MSGAERERRLRAGDGAARRRAQVDFERPLVLEAGAGTGKTTALVARIVAWCLLPGWERAESEGVEGPDRIASRVLSGVVAITFTEAAAAEMGRRVGEALHAIEGGDVPLGVFEDLLPAPAARRTLRARALRGALDHLVVQTIHAYCRRLLVAHPLDAGMHPALEVDADQRQGREIVRELLEQRLRDAYAGESDLLALARSGVGPQELEVELLALLDAGLPAAAFRGDPFAPARVAALGVRLREQADAVRAAGASLAGLAGSQVSIDTLACVERLAARLRERACADRGDLAEWVAWIGTQVGDRERGRLAQWGAGRFGKREAAALGPDAQALAGPAGALATLLAHLADLDPERLDLARRGFGELLAGVEAEMRARGVASFGALLDGAGRLLASSPRVAASVRSRIDQLLVDEFQDTDRRQCEIIRAIALEGPPGERPGLFVVGDPKQSIYGWRSADLSAYEGFVSEVVGAGGALERLSVNHRSVPGLLDEVERAVAPVMRAQAGIQPAFQPLVASEVHRGRAGHADARSAPVEYWVSAEWDGGAPARTSAAGASGLEARALARDLRRLHDREGLAWSSFGVLFRSRTDWDLYLGALREAGVPFAVEGDRSYYRRREIVDAAGLVRCVLDPNDVLALLTLLRSAPVGVPDAALIPLWRHELPFLVSRVDAPGEEPLAAARRAVAAAAAALPEGVPGLERVAGWERNLCAALEALAELRAAAREDAADVFVEKLRLSTLLEATEAARYQGAWRVANLDRFFRELLDDLDEGGDFHRVLRRLRAAVAEELDAEEGRPREILDDAVQIMTIHGAKGLDFDHVYLMQCHKGRASGRERQVDYGQVDGGTEYRVLGAATPGWDRVERARARVEEAERVRTFYVALTRARRRLVVAGLWPALQSRRGSGSLAALLEARAGGAPDPAGWMTRAAASGTPCVDAEGARWVFPALEGGDEEAPAAPAEDAPALPDARRIRAESAALRAARRAMRARMQRVLSGAASREAQDDPELDTERRFGRPGGDADPAGEEARAVGTAIHRALEHFDFGADPAGELARAQREIDASLEAALPAAVRERARARARRAFGRFAAGPLLARLRQLSGRIVARELPVLVLPEAAGDGPLAAVSGAIDLVYRDPQSDELVIADYKTGRPRDHAAQGAHYRRALQGALRLSYAPRFELWYLEEGRIETA